MTIEHAKIFIAGHRGMVGSAIYRYLLSIGYPKDLIITASREELDLTSQNQVNGFLASAKPDIVYLAAAKVGGISANNTFPADFIYENLMIEANVIEASFRNNIKKLLFLGSSCIYPKLCSQPIREEYLLTGELEATNEPYAIAKIAGIKLCQSFNRQFGASHGVDYRCVMPTNLYGPGDNYHPINSHVIPGLLRRFHEAKINKDGEVLVWGTGSAKREFLHVEDLAKASVFVMNLSKNDYRLITDEHINHINIGYGKDISIKELSCIIAKVVGYEGNIVYDTSRPDGPPKKLLDISKMTKLGWQANIDLETGLQTTYQDFLRDFIVCKGLSDGKTA